MGKETLLLAGWLEICEMAGEGGQWKGIAGMESKGLS
jgi:hypothetical protein